MPQTIYGGKDFARQFRVVRNNTLQIAEDIPESKYGFVPAPGCRPVAVLLTHIAVSPRMWYEVHGKQRVKTLVGFDFVKLSSDVRAEEVRSPEARRRFSIYCALRERNLPDGWIRRRLSFWRKWSPWPITQAQSRVLNSCSAPRNTRCTIVAS